MAFQRTQMEALGLDWERLEAVSTDDLLEPISDPCWQRWERPMKATEIACLLSHRAAWERVQQADSPHLILEDDALLADETRSFLGKLDLESGIDHVSLEVRGRRKLVGVRYPTLPMRRLYQDRTGAAAYVLWPSGARHLCTRADRRAGLADAIICGSYALRSWQADPALAVQLDQCDEYGFKAPVRSRSSIAPGVAPQRTAAHVFRRVSAQLRMGLRHLSLYAVADRCWIPLSPSIRSGVVTPKPSSQA